MWLNLKCNLYENEMYPLCNIICFSNEIKRFKHGKCLLKWTLKPYKHLLDSILSRFVELALIPYFYEHLKIILVRYCEKKRVK